MRPSPGTAAYGAAKAGLVNLTQTLAVEWAPKVRVNCVSAGLVATGRRATTTTAGRRAARRWRPPCPSAGSARPADIAPLCLFLASPELAGYVSGANLVVHGGGEWPAFLAATDRSAGLTAAVAAPTGQRQRPGKTSSSAAIRSITGGWARAFQRP